MIGNIMKGSSRIKIDSSVKNELIGNIPDDEWDEKEI